VADETPALRPLGFGEILDVAIKIVTRHWKTLSACVLLAVAPLVIVNAVVTYSIAPEQFDLSTTETGVSADEADTWAGSQIVLGLLQTFAILVATAACFKAVGDAYLGREPSAGRSLGFGLKRLPRLFGLYLVTAFALVIAFILLIIPGLWLTTVWALALPAFVFERTGIFRSLGRSFELVKGRFWATFLLWFVSFLLFVVFGAILGFALGALAAVAAGDSVLAGAVAMTLIELLVYVLLTPILASVLSVLYFDQRVRKEGFDLQLLAHGLGEEGRPPVPPDTTWDRPAQPQWQPPQSPPVPPRGV
jgi:Membrane domain of glycerophosphoryl diester phosphodiesterase